MPWKDAGGPKCAEDLPVFNLWYQVSEAGWRLVEVVQIIPDPDNSHRRVRDLGENGAALGCCVLQDTGGPVRRCGDDNTIGFKLSTACEDLEPPIDHVQSVDLGTGVDVFPHVRRKTIGKLGNPLPETCKDSPRPGRA